MLCHVTYAYDPKTSSGFVNEAFAAAMSSFFVKVVEKKVKKSMSFGRITGLRSSFGSRSDIFQLSVCTQ